MGYVVPEYLIIKQYDFYYIQHNNIGTIDGPYTTLKGARRALKNKINTNSKREIIERYDKNGNLIQ